MKKNFFICGIRPIYQEIDANALPSTKTFVYNWQTKSFDENSDYTSRIACNVQVDELESVTEEEFWPYVEKLKLRE
jgi:hypothetical protein